MRERIRHWIRTRLSRVADSLSPRQEEAREKLLLTSQMVHDVKGVLTAIYGSSILIQQESACEIARGYGEQIIKSTDYLNRMLEDILAVNQAELGNLPVRPGPLDVREELREALQVYRLRCTRKKLRFDLTFAPTIPSIVITDSLRLNQIVSNIVSNAVKFTNEGSVQVNVDYQANMLSVRVRDTGPGIPESDLKTLFDPYRRGGRSPEGEGHGLGLAFTRRLALLLGGDLVLLPSTDKIGCTFCVTLQAPPV